jgi:hypothetical protein
MHRFRVLPVVAVVAASLLFAVPASADAPDVFGIEYDASFTLTNCGFPVNVSVHGTFENRSFVDPVFNINYIREEGTATNPANGATLLIRHMYTEIGRPPTSPEEGWGTFADRGLITRVLLPGGGVVLIDAGYLRWRFPDGFVFEAHGNHELEIEGDLTELCAALAG